MISGGSQLLPLGNRTAIAQEILALDYRAAYSSAYMEYLFWTERVERYFGKVAREILDRV